MGDHELFEPAPQLVTEGLSPKTIWSTVWALALPLLVTGADALIGYVLSNPGVLSALPPVVRVVLMALLSASGAAVAAYRARPGVVVVQNA